MSISTNALFPLNIATTGANLPRNFVNRAAMNAIDVQSATKLVSKTTTTASGFNLNVAMPGVVFATEVGPNVTYTKASGTDNEPAVWFHFNSYKYITSVPQYHDTSSFHREARADAMPVPYDSRTIRNILGDHQDEAWPIYRLGAFPDVDANTIATVIYDHTERTMSLWCAQNPKDEQPCAVIPF